MKPTKYVERVMRGARHIGVVSFFMNHVPNNCNISTKKENSLQAYMWFEVKYNKELDFTAGK